MSNETTTFQRRNDRVARAKGLLINELHDFIGLQQRSALGNLLRGEEREHFATILIDLADRIAKMPKTYEQDGKDDAIVYLHYFRGPIDAWVTEKDMDTDNEGQLQAFGWIRMVPGDKDEAEMGYIPIKELIANDIEIDLHWTPKPWSKVQA